jgi:carbamoylphosphate synthase large subunit
MTFVLLMTCVGGELGPEVIKAAKASKRHDIRVIGVDNRPNAIGRHFADAFYQVPLGTDPAYVQAIARIVGKERVDLVLPTSDEEALALSAARGEIEIGGCKLTCADNKTLDIVSSKSRTYETLGKFGFGVPTYRHVKNLDDLRSAVQMLARDVGDVVVKPAQARGGRGVFVIRNDIVGAMPLQGGREIHVDLSTFLKETIDEVVPHLPAMVMPRLVEPVHDLDMLAWQGRPLRIIARRRVDSALPNEGHVVVDDPALIELGDKLIHSLSLSWLYDCDVMYGADGKPYVLEVNPRPSGSIAVTMAAGIPLIDDLVCLAKGEAIDPIDPPVGRVIMPYKSLTVAKP